MLNGLAAIVVFGLTFALWGLYHKIFNVVYFNAPVALLREFVICFVIACAIIAGVTSPIRSFLHPDKTEKFCGVFFNTELLNGSEFDSSIIIRKSDQVKGGIQIEGIAYEIGENVRYSFTQDIPCPDSNTFTFEVYGRDSISGEYPINYTTKYTIKINSKKETLNVVEETDRTDVLAPFAGDYVGSDAWEKLLPERQAAENAAMEAAEQRRAAEAEAQEKLDAAWAQEMTEIAEEAARKRAEQSAAVEQEMERRAAEQIASTPNLWISDYFGIYVPSSFAEGEAPSICRPIILAEGNDSYFAIICGAPKDLQWAYDYPWYIPYPLGPDASTTHIEYSSSDGFIAFDVMGHTADDRKIIEITDFPDVAYIGEYVQGEDLLPELYLWDGTYVCERGGTDGRKTITVQRNDDMTLSVSLYHIYGDGHEEYLDLTPQIGAYGNGEGFAYETDYSFTLQQDELTGVYSIALSQAYIYPDIDLKFDGVYIKQEPA